MLNLKWDTLTDVLDKAAKDGATDKTIVQVIVQISGHPKYTKKIHFKDLKGVMWNMIDHQFNIAQLTVSIEDKTLLDYRDGNKPKAKNRSNGVEERPIGTSPMIQEWFALTTRKRTTIIEALCKQIQREIS